MTEFGDLKDRACKCTDKACADKVIAEVEEWADANQGGGMDATPEQEKKMEQAGMALGLCLVKNGVPPQKLIELGERMGAE